MKHICLSINCAALAFLLIYSDEAGVASVAVTRGPTHPSSRESVLNRSKVNKLVARPNTVNVSPVNKNHDEFKKMMKIVDELEGEIHRGSQEKSPLEETAKQQLIGEIFEYWRMQK